MNLPFFLARRFFRTHDTGSNSAGQLGYSAPAVRIATAGVALGLTVMIVSVSVVLGFKQEIRQKLTGFAAHMEVVDPYIFSSPESYPIAADSALLQLLNVSGVSHVQRFAEKMGVLKTPDDFQAISLKGLSAEYDTTFLHRSLVRGTLPPRREGRSSNAIAISQNLAQLLGLNIGDRVYAYFFESNVQTRRFTICGIYQTHLKQFDNAIVLTDMATVNRLNHWQADQASGVEIHLSDLSLLEPVADTLRSRLDGKTDKYHGVYGLVTLREHPRTAGVVSWLGLLDVNVWVILVLVALVAAFSMVSGLLILILERTQAIGTLKALGATNTRIRHTFLLYASLIAGRGLVIGNVVGCLLVFLQWHFGLVHLNAETYYVDTVPVSFSPLLIVALNAATLLLTLLALIVPSFLISRIQPAKAIRFD